jgi:hypothetical protein
MAFPLLLGAVASAVGIRLTYIVVGVIILGVLLTVIATQKWWDRLGEAQDPAT